MHLPRLQPLKSARVSRPTEAFLLSWVETKRRLLPMLQRLNLSETRRVQLPSRLTDLVPRTARPCIHVSCPRRNAFFTPAQKLG